MVIRGGGAADAKPPRETASYPPGQVVIRGEVQRMRNRVVHAYDAVEALAKAVYSAMFDDLVRVAKPPRETAA